MGAGHAGENSAGFNTTEMATRRKAVWWNLNTGWAIAPRTHRVKQPEAILRDLRAHSQGAVFVLNVGPRPGDVHPEEQQRTADRTDDPRIRLVTRRYGDERTRKELATIRREPTDVSPPMPFAWKTRPRSPCTWGLALIQCSTDWH